MDPPSGTVTFLFTDIEGSTRLWEAAPSAMAPALERHDDIVRGAVQANHGYVFATGGDGFAAAFARVRDALSAGTSAQAALQAEPWPTGARLQVRMAAHTGDAIEREGDYFGTAVNQAARLLALAHGGQFLCSGATAALVVAEVPLVDLGEHRLKDLSLPQRVFQVGRGQFPALRSVEAAATNLPMVRTELIGREADLGALSRLLVERKLTTVTGVGGVGKTHLALAAASTAAPGYVDGCWFVDLSTVTGDADVATVAAGALQAPAAGTEALATYLSPRRLLLVLDNCEHVLDGASRLAEAVLAHAPDVTVLATSREALGVDGEAVYRVGTLPLPEEGAGAQGARTSAAVQLFIDRSGSVTAPFELGEGNVDAVVSICRHLDGIPLAIELAGARARSMPVGDIARRLGERFPLLSSGNRRVDDRHRTLLAAVSWSHDLLSDAERTVFRRLSVFPGSFDLPAVEAVCAQDDLEVIEILLRLVDRSLVAYEANEERYHLLETIRHYAADRLDDAGERAAAHDTHTRHFMRLAAAATTGPATEAFNAAAEIDNLRSAVGWLSGEQRWHQLLQFCADLTLPLNGSSALFGWYRDAVAAVPSLDDQERVDALGRVAYTGALAMTDFDVALSFAEEAIALAQARGLAPSPFAFEALTLAGLFHGDFAEARRAVEAAVAAAEARGDIQAVCGTMATLATVLAAQGDLAQSERVAEGALHRGRAAGDAYSLAITLVCAASSRTVARLGGPDFEGALAVLRANPVDLASLEPATTIWLDQMWGIAYLGTGPVEESVRHLTRSIVTADRTGTYSAIDQTIRLLALAHGRAGRADVAQRLVEYADQHSQTYVMSNPIQAWVEAQWASLDASAERSGYSDSVTVGPILDRQGFIKLITTAAALVLNHVTT
jgi:predicted ATPase/class 3 adenylate cyclase